MSELSDKKLIRETTVIPNSIAISALPFAIGSVCYFILISRLCTLQQKTNTRIANSFLSVFLAVFALQQFDDFLILSQLLLIPHPLYSALQIASHLLIGPCVYLYVCLMTDGRFSKSELMHNSALHFTPAGLFFVFIYVASLFWPQHLQMLETAVIVCYVASLIGYPLLAIMKLKTSLGRSRDLFANLEKHDLNFARHWLLLLVFLALYVLAVEPLLGWSIPEYQRYFNANLWVAVAGLLTCLKNNFSAQAFTDHSDHVLVEYALAPSTADVGEDAQAQQKNQPSLILQQLNLLMCEQRLYLNNDLSLGDLAHSSGFRFHQVSAALNADDDSCFYDYVNAYRVAAAAKLLLAHPAKAVLDIAMDAGFNSKSAFYSAFKKKLQTTPSAYRQQQLKLSQKPL
ncbi:MAG: hypothetical protein OFPI_24810 [Osedax symbiont Rs2]|nr:MAG: hypothetical protein OFPI_24810 [Osedax symbiont Rs2]